MLISWYLFGLIQFDHADPETLLFLSLIEVHQSRGQYFPPNFIWPADRYPPSQYPHQYYPPPWCNPPADPSFSRFSNVSASPRNIGSRYRYDIGNIVSNLVQSSSEVKFFFSKIGSIFCRWYSLTYLYFWMRICSSTLGSTMAQRGGQYFLEYLFPKTEAMFFEHRKHSRASWYAISSDIFIFCDWHHSLWIQVVSLLQYFQAWYCKNPLSRTGQFPVTDPGCLTNRSSIETYCYPHWCCIGDSEYRREVIKVLLSNLSQSMKMLITFVGQHRATGQICSLLLNAAQCGALSGVYLQTQVYCGVSTFVAWRSAANCWGKVNPML